MFPARARETTLEASVIPKAGALSESMIDDRSMIDSIEYFRVAMEILAEELLSAKVDGKPIMENLKVVDRLIRVAGLPD